MLAAAWYVPINRLDSVFIVFQRRVIDSRSAHDFRTSSGLARVVLSLAQFRPSTHRIPDKYLMRNIQKNTSEKLRREAVFLPLSEPCISDNTTLTLAEAPGRR